MKVKVPQAIRDCSALGYSTTKMLGLVNQGDDNPFVGIGRTLTYSPCVDLDFITALKETIETFKVSLKSGSSLSKVEVDVYCCLLGGETSLAWCNRVLRDVLGSDLYQSYISAYSPVLLSEVAHRDDLDSFSDRLARDTAFYFTERVDEILELAKSASGLVQLRSGITRLKDSASRRLESLTDTISLALTASELAGVYEAQQALDQPALFTETDPYSLAFTEAVDHFKERINLPINPADIQSDWHNYAFFVSGVTDAKLLAYFRDLVDSAIEDGMDYREFERKFIEKAESSGWQPSDGYANRARLVYDANLRQAYSFGQIQQYTRPEVLAEYPSWEWRHRDSPRPRPHHIEQDGRLFPAQEHPPLALPSGFGCRCRWIPRRESPTHSFQFVDVLNKKTGQIESTPAIEVNGKLTPLSDPGWRPFDNRRREEIRAAIIDSLPEDLKP